MQFVFCRYNERIVFHHFLVMHTHDDAIFHVTLVYFDGKFLFRDEKYVSIHWKRRTSPAIPFCVLVLAGIVGITYRDTRT